MNTTHTPWYVKAASLGGRPAVLAAAILMSAPAEIRLFETAGFSGGTQFLAPFVLSVYAICAAVVATTRPKGVRGRVSAIVGAITALGFALSAQVGAHLISAGYMGSGPWLIAAISAVPSISAAHLLHLAVTPKSGAVGVTKAESLNGDDEKPVNGSETDTENAIPAAPKKDAQRPPTGRPKPGPHSGCCSEP